MSIPLPLSSSRSITTILMEPPSDGKDLISELPDDCLALILQGVGHSDLNSCNLVCRRWFFLQGQIRQYLTLCLAKVNISSIPVLFSRFSSVTKLVIRGGSSAAHAKKTLSDEELELISIKCTNLSTFKLFSIYGEDVTDVGMAALGTHATRLKKFSCRSCGFGGKPLNALLSHSSSLETISLCEFRPRGELIYSSSSLKSISLKNILSSPQWFKPLLVGSKNLTSLRIGRCHGDWSDVLNWVASRDNCLLEVYLNKVPVIRDVALSALSNFSKLENLHVIGNYMSGICLNDEALISIATKCLNLTTFKLTGLCNVVTHVGMAALGMHAKRLTKFWCQNCKFGAKGLNALVSNSSSLQKISVKDLRVNGTNRIYPCAVGSSLESICLENLYENHWPQCFAPLITRSKKLTSLKLLGCSGNWDDVFKMLAIRENSLYELNLNEVEVTDAGLSALSSFPKLEILHVIATPNCTYRGFVSVVKHCKSLRKLHVEERMLKRNLKKDGLSSIRKYYPKLQIVIHPHIDP